MMELLADTAAAAWWQLAERRQDASRWRQIMALNYRPPAMWPDPRTIDSTLVGVWIRRNGIVPMAEIPPVDSSWVRPRSRSFAELETLALALISSARLEEAVLLRPHLAQRAVRDRERERLALLDELTGQAGKHHP